MLRNLSLLSVTSLLLIGRASAQGDTCTTAWPVTSGLHHADGPTTGWAGPACNGGGTHGDWYVYLAPFTGTINITSCNPLNNNVDDDTYVRVYTGNCGTLTCIGGNDDMGANSCPGYVFATYLDVPVVAGQSYYIVWTNMFDSDDFYWNLSECYATVTGTTYRDNNANGLRDIGELHAPVVLEVNPGGQYVYAGQDPYAFCSDSGSFTITVPNPPLYHTASPSSQSYSASNLGTLVTGMDFGFVPVPGMYDGTVSIWGWNPWIGNDATYNINYQNVGTEPLDGTISVTLDPLTSFVAAVPAPDSVNGQVVLWDLVNIAPGAGGLIHLVYHTDSTAVPSDTVTASVVLDNDHLDQTPTDNADAITGHPTTSFDPNEKLVDAEWITMDDVADARKLEYTVHFQNTGTMPAVNVIVRDMIDPDLDLSTFEMVGATHDNYVQIIGQEVVWTFPQIMLPDSASAPESSIGGLHFRIAPRATSLPGTQFTNAVGIVFDYNTPVITNTVVTEVTITEGVNERMAQGQVVYPSPGDGHVQLRWERASISNATLTVTDASGRTVHRQSGVSINPGGQLAIDLSGLSDGVYVLRVMDGTMSASSPLIIRH